MPRRVWWWMAVLAWVGCDDQSPPKDGADEQVPEHVRADDTGLTAQARDKLTACGLHLPIEGESRDRSLIRDELDRCIARCHLTAACDDVVVTTCEQRETPFSQCVLACPERPQDGFRCDGGERIPHLALCDGEEDCRNGEDEADCAPACANGTSLASKQLVCDGNRDCADGSDEIDCIVCPDVEI
jgi:hypothetical protein